MKSGNKTTNGHPAEAAEFFEEAVRSFKKKTSGLKDKSLHELSGDLKGYVREHPYRSLLMAVGAGFLLGLILKRNK